MAVTDSAAEFNQPQQTRSMLAPPPSGENVMLHLEGPGLFHAAEINKLGGLEDVSMVRLEIDGEDVVHAVFRADENTNTEKAGVVLFTNSSGRSMTIGFAKPLRFKNDLKLSVLVRETGILQLFANVFYSTKLSVPA